jgi:hypothetical protein
MMAAMPSIKISHQGTEDVSDWVATVSEVIFSLLGVSG